MHDTTTRRYAAIQARFKQLRKEGYKSSFILSKLAEEFYASERTIERVVYSHNANSTLSFNVKKSI
ncbi:MAG: hypothetical protein RLZZ292_2237 [Bacteroidota bacterium]|jgi:hypothetical protein